MSASSEGQNHLAADKINRYASLCQHVATHEYIRLATQGRKAGELAVKLEHIANPDCDGVVFGGNWFPPGLVNFPDWTNWSQSEVTDDARPQSRASSPSVDHGKVVSRASSVAFRSDADLEHRAYGS